MKSYFIVSVQIQDQRLRPLYDEYIACVRPVVERYGGSYLVRTEKICALSEAWSPDRVIVIEFPDRQALDSCFASEEYRAIAGLRMQSVKADAIIVEGCLPG